MLWTKDAQYNQSHVDLPEAENLVKQADVSTDDAGRLKQYQQAEQLWVSQGAAIPLYQDIQNNAARSRVSRWQIGPTGMTPSACGRRCT
jgi:ABC-type transport system substrate-binding protein